MSYEYLNTRVRVLKSRLLTAAQFAAYADFHSLDDLVSALSETDYRPDLEQAAVRFRGLAQVEDTLLRNAQRCFHKLHRIAPAPLKGMVDILLERFEVFNLKTVLRGKHSGVSAQAVLDNLFPPFISTLGFYQELMSKESIEACIAYLTAVGHPYGRWLAQALPQYKSTQRLALLEHALDNRYFGQARRLLRANYWEKGHNVEIVEQALGLEVDVLNVVYALRLIESRVSTEERHRYVLEGGWQLSAAFMRGLLESTDVESYFRQLQQTYLARRIQLGSDVLNANMLQERLEAHLYVALSGWDLARPFDLSLARSYIWRKVREMVNLRVLASGLFHGISREQVRVQLIPWTATAEGAPA